MKEIKVKSFDGKKLSVKVWDDVIDPKGVIQIVHGAMEHSGCYEEFAQSINKKGYFVYLSDVRGFGNSVDSLSDIGVSKKTADAGQPNMVEASLKDVFQITQKIKENHGDLPINLVSQGLNCLLAQRYIQEYPDAVASAILLSPTYFKGFKYNFAKFISFIMRKIKGDSAPARLFEKLTVTRWTKKEAKKGGFWMSNNSEFAEKYLADELCNKYPAYSYFNDMFKLSSCVYNKKNFKKTVKRMPIQILAGQQDLACKKGVSAKHLNMFYIEQGFYDTEIKLFNDEKHYLINGSEKEKVQKALFMFVVSVGNKIERDRVDAEVANAKREEEKKQMEEFEGVTWQFSENEGILKLKDGKKIANCTLLKKHEEPKPVNKAAAEAVLDNKTETPIQKAPDVEKSSDKTEVKTTVRKPRDNAVDVSGNKKTTTQVKK